VSSAHTLPLADRISNHANPNCRLHRSARHSRSQIPGSRDCRPALGAQGSPQKQIRGRHHHYRPLPGPRKDRRPHRRALRRLSSDYRCSPFRWPVRDWCRDQAGGGRGRIYSEELLLPGFGQVGVRIGSNARAHGVAAPPIYQVVDDNSCLQDVRGLDFPHGRVA
jgi:hypothetical protein